MPAPDPYAPDLDACRARQQRLLTAAEPLADALLLSRVESVQWATGALVRPPMQPLALVTSTGHTTLVLPERQIGSPAAADETIGYEAKWHSTTRDDQWAATAEALLKHCAERALAAPRRLGCEFASYSPHLAGLWSDVPRVDIGPTLFQLRRRKDPDELRMLRRANEANRAMYAAARSLIRPGVNELDLYAALHAEAVRTLGEPLTYFGQDFRSGARGGPPRDRPAEAGEMYILDLGVGFRGYHSDNARTIAVDGEPTEPQRRAWAAVRDVLTMAESRVRPGASCRQLFLDAERELAAAAPWAFNHHLGHGVGLAPQEGPHLNPRWDDVFEEGDWLAVEPGLYHEALRQGIRLEQNYLVTAGGVELETDWPLEL